jgi:hypothetical protein
MSVRVNSAISEILSIPNNLHNLESTIVYNLVVQCIRTTVQRKAIEYLHARPNKIICWVIQEANPIFYKSNTS